MIVVAEYRHDALLRAGGDHAAHDVERAVAVERRDLDGDDVVDPAKRRQNDDDSAIPPTAGCR